MTGIFFDGDTKVCLNFSSNFENLPYVVVFFFNRKSNFVRKQIFSKKVHAKFKILCIT